MRRPTLSDDPSSAASAAGAIGDLELLPLFYKLRGREALIAGGTAPAAWKADLLAAAGARVTLCAQEPCPELLTLAERRPDRLTIHRRSVEPADLAGKAIAIGALAGEAAERFRAAARAAGVPVNIIDTPDLCDFQFGTIVERSPLLIGISTGGAAPVFGQALRSRIETLLPARMAEWAQAAQAWRRRIQSRDWTFAARRRFWERYADLALSAGARAPTEPDFGACEQAGREAADRGRGRLTLVGAGDGSLEQMTLGAIRALQDADLVIHDLRVPPEILNQARREAERMAETDIERAAQHAQDEASAGRSVVWLAPGAPYACPCWQRRRAALDGSKPDAPALTITPTVPAPGCAACAQD